VTRGTWPLPGLSASLFQLEAYNVNGVCNVHLRKNWPRVPRMLKRLAARLHVAQPVVLILMTLLIGGVFKLSAFVREAFITSRFGFSSTTDAYFALQQLPLTVSAFMMGPFSRAFTPVYGASYQSNGRVNWFSGLIVYVSVVGLALTALTIGFAPLILHAVTRSGSSATLVTLSLCYVPIMLIGFRASTWTSYGKNLWSLSLTGLPYLVMTILLVGMYFANQLSDLSLPISMTGGFGFVGVISLGHLLWKEKPFQGAPNPLLVWRNREFRTFLKRLLASSSETFGYSASQFVMLYFMARAGTGIISANNSATRIGWLGYSLVVLPLLQLIQSRLCQSTESDRKSLAWRCVLGMGASAFAFALLVFLFRYQIAALVYMHGKVSAAALEQVVAILPAWLAYFVVVSLNSSISLYMFYSLKAYSYARNMLLGYLVTNILRILLAGRMEPSWIIWCGVIAEGGAFLANVLTTTAAARTPRTVQVAEVSVT